MEERKTCFSGEYSLSVWTQGLSMSSPVYASSCPQLWRRPDHFPTGGFVRIIWQLKLWGTFFSSVQVKTFKTFSSYLPLWLWERRWHHSLRSTESQKWDGFVHLQGRGEGVSPPTQTDFIVCFQTEISKMFTNSIHWNLSEHLTFPSWLHTFIHSKRQKNNVEVKFVPGTMTIM